jgi:hypothetical protein
VTELEQLQSDNKTLRDLLHRERFKVSIMREALEWYAETDCDEEQNSKAYAQDALRSVDRATSPTPRSGE